MRIGITGSIGSGKSEVASYLREKGYFVFDCDQAVKQAYDPTSLVFDSLVALLGKASFDSNNHVLRDKVRAQILAHSDLKQALEGILHPYVKEAMRKAFAAQKQDLVFAEVPLLFEAGWEKEFDAILCVATQKRTACERLIQARGLTQDEANALWEAQMDVSSKIEKSTVVVYNDTTIQDLHQALDGLLEKWGK